VARNVKFHIKSFGWDFIFVAQHGNDTEAFLLLTEVPSDCAVEQSVDEMVHPSE
jgi:hypothetical protein